MQAELEKHRAPQPAAPRSFYWLVALNLFLALGLLAILFTRPSLATTEMEERLPAASMSSMLREEL